MEFFKELFLISEGLDITLKVKRVKEKLTISILPDMADGVDPLILTGTWEELDKDFFTHIKPAMDGARVTMNNLQDFQSQIKELEEIKKKELDQKKATPVKTPATKPAKKKTPPAKSKAKKVNAEDPINEEDDDSEEIADAKKIAKNETTAPKKAAAKPKPIQEPKKEEPAGPVQLLIS